MKRQKLMNEIETARQLTNTAATKDGDINTLSAISWLSDVLESLVIEVDELTRANQELEAALIEANVWVKSLER